MRSRGSLPWGISSVCLFLADHIVKAARPFAQRSELIKGSSMILHWFCISAAQSFAESKLCMNISIYILYLSTVALGQCQKDQEMLKDLFDNGVPQAVKM